MGRVKQADRVNKKLAEMKGESVKKHAGAGKSQSTLPSDAQRKKHRKRSGTRALMDIRKFQGMTSKRRGKTDAATALLIQRQPMSRLIREILADITRDTGTAYMIKATAVDELHTAAEAAITSMFAGAQSLAQHRGAVSAERKDLRMFNYCHECPIEAISALADPKYNEEQVSWRPTNKVSSVDIHDLSKAAW